MLGRQRVRLCALGRGAQRNQSAGRWLRSPVALKARIRTSKEDRTHLALRPINERRNPSLVHNPDDARAYALDAWPFVLTQCGRRDRRSGWMLWNVRYGQIDRVALSRPPVHVMVRPRRLPSYRATLFRRRSRRICSSSWFALVVATTSDAFCVYGAIVDAPPDASQLVGATDDWIKEIKTVGSNSPSLDHTGNSFRR